MIRNAGLIVILAWATAGGSSRIALCADPPTSERRVPVIYSTDLFHPHDDPDDHYDLATLFAIAEFDIKAIILDLGDRQKQRPGRVPLEQMMRLTGRRVPYAMGLPGKLKSPSDKGLDQPAEDQRGIELLLKTLGEAEAGVTIITAGSLRDLCAAFNREPGLLKAKVARVYVNIGATDTTVEWNVNLDLNAYLGLMRSGLPIWWCPCLPMRVNEHSTFWKFRQSDILEGLPASAAELLHLRPATGSTGGNRPRPGTGDRPSTLATHDRNDGSQHVVHGPSPARGRAAGVRPRQRVYRGHHGTGGYSAGQLVYFQGRPGADR